MVLFAGSEWSVLYSVRSCAADVMNHCLVVCIAVLVSIPAAALPSVQADEADADFLYAAGFYRTKRWEYSANAFRDFLKKHPEHPRAVLAKLYYGLSLNSLEKYEESRRQLQAFVTADPESQYVVEAKYRIGEGSYYLQDYPRAVTELKKYLTDHPQHSLRDWGRLLLGESLNELRKFAEAEVELRQLVETPPPAAILPDATFALAESLYGLNRPSDALPVYEKVAALKSDRFSHRALFRVGELHLNENQFAKAIEAFDRVVADFPDKPLAASAELQAGIACYRMRDFKQAYDRFKRIAPDSDAAAYKDLWMGLALLEGGEIPLARAQLLQAYTNAKDSTLAAEILFHRAGLEALDNHKDIAAQMYLDLADRWPADSRVAISLFYASELQLELQELPAARRLLNRLRSDYPQEFQKPETQVLEGRLLLSEGQYQPAVDVLKSAVASNAGSQDQILFRNYHLIRALYKAGGFQEVVATFEPLQAQFAEEKSRSMAGAIALAALGSVETGAYTEAKKYADQFLSLESDPRKKSDALAARAIALAHLRQIKDSQADLKTLTTEFPENSQTWMAVLQSAEAAWAQEDYASAASVFEMATGPQTSGRVLEAALSGAAWSYYRVDQFQNSSELFERLLTEFPESAAASEARYMHGRCLVNLGRTADAAQQFLALYESLERQQDGSTAPDQVPYLMESGRMYARLMADNSRLEDANTMWERMAKTFAESAQLDRLLDEWATVNLQNQQYTRSDEIYRQLLKQFPNSAFAGQARLSLAESEMQANRLDQALQEFIQIASHKDYSEVEKEAALYHVVDIYAARREWKEVIHFAEDFGTRYSGSKLAPMVQLLYGEALLDQQRFAESLAKLDTLRTAVLEGRLTTEDWTERIWVALAELALAEKRYADIDAIEAELESRFPKSRFLFQVHDVQGRRWKSQAPPDFLRAREYFAKVIQNPAARGTETAARCQFLIAETLLMQKDYAAAASEYYRVYLNYPFDELRARGLFQAAGCEVQLKKYSEATRSYQDLIRDFPENTLAREARERLQKLPSE